MKLDRRNFLSVAGGAVGGAALGRVSLRGLSSLNEALAPEPASYPGEEKWAHSICRQCSGGCGLRVRTVGGKAIKVDGNPAYPVNRGGVCPRAQALLQWVYHPDRILAPQRREKGSERWEAVSWDQALPALAAALRKPRSQNRADRLMVVSGRTPGVTRQLLSRFLSAYGSNNGFGLPTGMSTTHQALEWMAGSLQTSGPTRLAYDLENSRCVLNFGCDLLEGWGTPSHTLRVFGRWRDSSRGRRTTLFHFGPRFSVSAARADEWVPLEVGTWGAAALGVAFVLISEDLYNHEFVENCTTGFEDWTDSAGRRHTGFKTLVREEYRLSRVAELTGIPTETLVRVAREFAAGPGAVAIGPQQSPSQPGRLSDALAIHSLNALAGSMGARGGVALLPESGWRLPPEDSPEAPESKTSNSLEEIIPALSKAPEVLILDEASWLLEMLSTEQLASLRRIPLIVTTASLLDSTTSVADLILPDCTSLESWTDGQSPEAYPYELLALSEPVLPPQGESRPWGDTILALARALDPGVASRLPWKDFPAVLRACAERVAQRQGGYLFGNEEDEQWERLLERSGWWAPEWNSPEAFWNQIRQKGGWWNPVSWPSEPQRSFPTPSGRFEFYPQKLEALLRQKGPRGEAGARDWDRSVLPHHAALLPPSDPKQFQFLLDPYEPLAFFGSGIRAIPFLQQIASPYGAGRGWQGWIELSDEDARHLGIRNGDWVWLESAKGRIRRRALVMEGAMPGIVGAPLGGPPVAGRWATDQLPLADILAPILDPVLGTRSSAVTRINIYKA